MKVAGPITDDTVDNGAQVELGAKSVKLQLTINARGSNGSLVDLEGMGALWRLHSGVNDGVQLGGYLVNLNRLERLGDKHWFAFGAAEPDMVTTEGNNQGIQKR